MLRKLFSEEFSSLGEEPLSENNTNKAFIIIMVIVIVNIQPRHFYQHSFPLMQWFVNQGKQKQGLFGD